MRSIFGRDRRRGAADETPVSRAPGLDSDRLRTLLDFFPIGRKLRYTPEFKQEIVLDTLVVGYCVNGDFVYAGEAIERDADGYPVAFRAGARGVSTLDTEVARHVVLADGPYAGSRMIVLAPVWPTLSVTDQRSKARAKTAAPVAVSIAGSRLPGACTIVDVSEDAIRIRCREAPLPPLQAGEPLTLDIDLGETERHYTIQGAAIRRTPETCVVRLDSQLKGGRPVRFEALDRLELKVGLLNYGR